MLLNDKVPFRMQWPQYTDLQVNGMLVQLLHAARLYGLLLGFLLFKFVWYRCNLGKLLFPTHRRFVHVLHASSISLCFDGHIGVAVRAINRPGSQLLGASGRDDGPMVSLLCSMAVMPLCC